MKPLPPLRCNQTANGAMFPGERQRAIGNTQLIGNTIVFLILFPAGNLGTTGITQTSGTPTYAGMARVRSSKLRRLARSPGFITSAGRPSLGEGQVISEIPPADFCCTFSGRLRNSKDPLSASAPRPEGCGISRITRPVRWVRRFTADLGRTYPSAGRKRYSTGSG
jgi:hypothetical protein